MKAPNFRGFFLLYLTMFKRLYEIISNTKNLSVKKVAFFVFSLNEVQKIIIDLNRIDQLFYDGINVDGQSLPTYKHTYDKVYTFEGKSNIKRKGEPYLLYDTGDFYKSFKVFPTTDGFIIYANDEKEDNNLTQSYGNGSKIIGLTDESKSKLSQEIIPYIVSFVRAEILR